MSEPYYITTAIAYPERRTTRRACLRIHRHRRDRAVQATRRLRRAVPDGHRRARPEDGRDGRRGRHSDRRTGAPQLRRVPAAAGEAQHLVRQVHPHQRRRPLRGVQGDLAADERLRRHLSRHLRGLVLGARRRLRHRGRNQRRPRRHAGRHRDRRARDVDRGADVLLPAVGLRRQAAGALRGAPGVHRAERAAQRGGQLRLRRAARLLDLAHDVRLGRAGARPSRPRHVRVGRRADQLPHRRRLPRHLPRSCSSGSGQPICT